MKSLLRTLEEQWNGGGASLSLAYYRRGQVKTWSWSDVGRIARSAAEEFRRKGVSAGDVCLLRLDTADRTAFEVLACLKLGAVPLVMDAIDLDARIAHYGDILSAEDLGVVDLPAGGGSVRRRGGGRGRWPRLRLLQATSGTTGVPNLCAWEEPQILASVEGMSHALALGPEDLSFCWTPLSHTVGLINNLIMCQLKRVPLCLMDADQFGRAPEEWLRGLSITGATITWGPNFAYEMTRRTVDADALRDLDFSQLRAVVNAGERIDCEQFRSFGHWLAPCGLDKASLLTNYGCAEHTGGISFLRPGSFESTTERTHSEATEVACVGEPWPDVEISVVSPKGGPVADAEVGEIVVRSPCVFPGYLGNESDTATRLHEGALHTGDLGYMREGRLYWTGRLKEAINLRGRKIDPSEFARPLALASGGQALPYSAFAIPDTDGGSEKIVLLVEAPEDADPERFQRECRRVLLETLRIGVSEILLLNSGTLQATRSGKRRNLFYRDRYLAGELDTDVVRRG